jgi:tripartite-type tricarboxylate transporter receptor subunit TctC
MLAQSSTTRALAAPKVPMVAEQTGIRDFDIAAWVGILVPRGAPPEIVTRTYLKIIGIVTSRIYNRIHAAFD